jgi:hypothetical protein
MQITTQAGGGPVGAVILLHKAIGGGMFCLILTWLGIVVHGYLRIKSYNAKHGATGLGATAGGWNYLLHSPIVVILLSVAFGVGFYLTVCWSSHY